jgi:hypothetical protein
MAANDSQQEGRMTQQAPTIQDKSGPVWGYRLMSILTAVLLLVQPILIAQFIADSSHTGFKDAHSVVAYVIFVTVVLQLILAYLARRTFGIGMVGHNFGLLVLVIIQVVLGVFSSDGHATAKEIHIPLGVFLFGMGLFAPFMGFYDLKAQRRPQ